MVAGVALQGMGKEAGEEGGAEHIERYVVDGAGAAGQEVLMDFICAGDQQGARESEGQRSRDQWIAIESGARGEQPGADEEDAEDAVSDEVAAFAEPEIKPLELHIGDADMQGQQRSPDHRESMRGAHGSGGFGGDDAEPGDDGEPCEQDPLGSQCGKLNWS